MRRCGAVPDVFKTPMPSGMSPAAAGAAASPCAAEADGDADTEAGGAAEPIGTDAGGGAELVAMGADVDIVGAAVGCVGTGRGRVATPLCHFMYPNVPPAPTAITSTSTIATTPRLLEDFLCATTGGLVPEASLDVECTMPDADG